MSDEKRADEKKPITDKDLDKVSGGYIRENPMSGAAPHPVLPIKPGSPEPC
jgi:bacteriocin-like protein